MDKLELPVGYLAFSHLAAPKAWGQGDEPKYDLTVAWPVADYEAKGGPWETVKRAIHNVAVEAWGERANARRDGPPYKVPFRYGADRETNPKQFEGYVLATFRSKYPIEVACLGDNGEVSQMPAAEVARGMRVEVVVKPKSWVANGRGITLYPFGVLVVDPAPDLDFNERTAGEGGGGVAYFQSRTAGGGGQQTPAKSPPAQSVAEAPAPVERPPADDIPF